MTHNTQEVYIFLSYATSASSTIIELYQDEKSDTSTIP